MEAFIAVLLIAGVLLFTINQEYIGKSDISEKVYGVQLGILREIELDNFLRGKIINSDGEVPEEVISRINQRLPDYLTCSSKICNLTEVCSLDKYTNKDIYAQSVAIAAEGEDYSPKQLKLFCWAS